MPILFIIVLILLGGCKKAPSYDDLPEYSDMGAAQDAQEVLTKP